VLSPEVVGIRESLMLLNSHIFKMTAMLKPSAEYNRRTATIIEGLRTERSATEIIQFFEYLRLTVYDVVAKYIALE